jgi:hypothetical protein
LLDTATKEQLQHLRIGMEANPTLDGISPLSENRITKLRTNFQSQVYVLNARKVSRFKKGYDTLPKNDHVNAWVIADHLRFGRLPHEMKEIIQYEALQRLTRTRFHLMKNN